MLNDVEQGIFQARKADLPRALGFVEGFCLARGVSPADGLRLTLVVEELFTNTVEHGHGADSESPIRLALGADASNIELLYEDHAPQFDPLATIAAAPEEPPLDLQARPVGGLGIVLVARLAASARYAFEDGCNRLWLVLRRSA